MTAGEEDNGQRGARAGAFGPPPAASMRGIRKSFGPVEVLHGVDFEVLPGEIHVLAGENGAGKSTLIKILSGVYTDFSGDLELGGRPHRFTHPSQAAAAGVATIHQELSLVPTMTVTDNLFLGREERGRWGQVDSGAQEAEARRMLKAAGLAVSPGQMVEDLPITQQQALEIARALARDSSVVVFDEPTSALDQTEVRRLFQRIRALRDDGRGIVYISHRMNEIYELADRITVLRDGAVVGTAAAENLSPESLVRWMVGQDPGKDGETIREVPGRVVLEVRGLSVSHPRIPGRHVTEEVSFHLREGEILGLAGLEGSGKSEVLHALFGALGNRVEGEVALNGRPFPDRAPGLCLRAGMVLLTNDRKTRGLAPEQSVAHSIGLAALDRFSGTLGWMRRGEERKAVEGMARDFRVNAPSLDAPVRVLSGGNQQKVYLARCLLPEPRVLLLDEPTRGIDVGAKADIYRLIREWVGGGLGIVLITSEMDELLDLSHRILVMHRGRVVLETDGREASRDRILAAAMGHGLFGDGGNDQLEKGGGA